MRNESLNQPPDGNADKKNDKTNGNSLKGASRKRRVGWQVVLASFGTLFFGAALSVHSWPSIPFAIAGVICGSLVLRAELQNRSFTHPVPRNWAMILAATALVVWLVVFLSEQKQPDKLPHIKFLVSTSAASHAWIELTNSFVLNTSFPKEFILNGALLLPASQIKQHFDLIIAIKNDSPVTIELGLAHFMLRKEWLCIPFQEWFLVENSSVVLGAGETNAMNCWMAHLMPILPGNTAILSPLRIEPSAEIPITSMSLMARAKDMKTIMVSCVLAFSETNSISAPVIARVEREPWPKGTIKKFIIPESK